MARGSVASLLDGFAGGYEMTGRVMRDSDLARIAQAKPSEELDPTGAKRVSFLGKTFDAMPDETAIGRGRQLAMAGVYEKHGDVRQGSELRQGVRRDEIADQGLAMQRQRFDWEKQQQADLAEQRKRDSALAAELQTVFKNSTIGKRSEAYAAAARTTEAQQAAYDAAITSGNRDVVAPTPPAVTPPSVGEAMLLNAEVLATKAKYGKASPEEFVKLAEMAKQIKDEGYINALMAAQAGKPLTEVVAQFNASGTMKMDPASIISDKMVDRDGVKSRVIVLKRPDGQTQTIDTLADLDAFGKADKVFSRTYAGNADRRGAAADARGAAAAGRAAQEFAAGASARELSGTLAKLQLERVQPNTTPERRQEIDQLLASSKGADTNAPAQVKLAEAMVRAGLRPNMADALEFAMTAKDKSPEALKADIYKTALTANMGNTKAAQQATEEAMKYLGGSGPAPKAAAGGGPAKGAVVDGYEFQGGDPKDAKNWKQVNARKTGGAVQ